MATKSDSDSSNPIGWRAIVGGLFVAILGGLLVNLLSAPSFDLNLAPPNAEHTPTPAEFLQARTIGPEAFGNVRSAQSKYGCTILLGLTDDEPLRVCNGSYNLPAKWVTKVQRFAPDCATTSSDRIIIELWTGEDLTGENWSYSSSC